MVSIANINNSLKTKDKGKFIDEISKLYTTILKEKQNTDGKINQDNLKNFKKITRSMTFDNLETLNVDFENMKHFEDFAFSNSSTNNSIKSILREPLLSKNINCVDDVLKIIFIGDQGVGKSFLINKLLDDKAEKDTYVHTKSFEIKKKNINLLGKRLTLELWDTNLEILNNDLSKGILYLSLVYINMCNGIFLIIDPTKPESIFFIEAQIQKIIKFSSSQNFFLIANINFLNNDFDKLREFQKKFAETDSYIRELVKKYDTKVHYINIEELKRFRCQIIKFLSLSFIKKGFYDLKGNNNYGNNLKKKLILKVKDYKNRRSLDNLKEDSVEILEN